VAGGTGRHSEASTCQGILHEDDDAIIAPLREFGAADDLVSTHRHPKSIPNQQGRGLMPGTLRGQGKALGSGSRSIVTRTVFTCWNNGPPPSWAALDSSVKQSWLRLQLLALSAYLPLSDSFTPAPYPQELFDSTLQMRGVGRTTRVYRL
jgi:hypothetical protein